MLKIAEFAQQAEALKAQARTALVSAGSSIVIPEKSEHPIRIVVAGQYSAGKSSILKLLTGRNDIETGAGITTKETHIYQWNGIELIDTPGVGTMLHPDHDAIAYDAIAAADMLIFVITNELFDAYIAEDFRRLAIDKHKADEMILVVNKMDCANDGNTQEQQEIIRDALQEVLSPLTPERLRLSFLDTKSYLKSFEVRPSDSQRAERLLVRSGYATFIATLNQFIREKRVSSRLTTDLYIVDDALDKAICELQPQSVNEDIDALEESLLQQRHLLVESRATIHQEVGAIFADAASKIRRIGLETADLVTEGCDPDDVATKLQESKVEVEGIIDQCQAEASRIIDERLSNVTQRLEYIESETLTQDLETRLVGGFDQLPNGIQRLIAQSTPGFQKAGQAVLNKAYKAGAQGGLKLTNFSGSSIHEMVIKVGHGLHFKFKPWQAIKVTRGIAVGGQILSAFGVILSTYTQIKSDHDEDMAREELRTNRQNIRSRFNDTASGLEEHSRQYIRDYIDSPLEEAISKLNSDIRDIRSTRTNRASECKHLEQLQEQCRQLIVQIHALPTP